MADRSVRAATAPEYVPTVPGLLRYATDRFGGRECVATPAGRLTYRDLDDASARLAARLVRAGVGKASRVGILFPNSVEWVLTWAAAARLGAVTIPVNTFYKPAELATFLRHADVQCIVGTASFLHHDYLERLETVAGGLEGARPPLHLPGLPHLRRVLLWGASDRGWAEGGLGSAAGRDDAEVAPVVAAMEGDVTPGDELFVTYTSGSTGEPKGVVHTHGGVIRHARNLAALSGVDTGGRLWSPMPLCWVGGFAFTLLRALSVGACYVSQAVFEPGEALATLERERVTDISGWPGVFKAMVEHPSFGTTDLGSVRAGSFYDAIPAGRRPADPGLCVTSLGMSETCGPHTFWTPEEQVHGSPERYRGSFGHQVPGLEHRIVDPDTGEDVPEGDEGEVLVRGYSLMKGLYKKERADTFDADGWYHTGDRGRFRDGWFFFTGRQSDLIKTRGSNVAPPEVERALLSVAGVKLAFVVGVPHPDDGEQVVALVVPWADAERPDAGAVLERLKAQLSSYKVPRHLFFLTDGEVPWLVSQKVDRRALAGNAARMIAQTPTGQEARPPQPTAPRPSPPRRPSGT